jgi:hypothetical protein
MKSTDAGTEEFVDANAYQTQNGFSNTMPQQYASHYP